MAHFATASTERALRIDASYGLAWRNAARMLDAQSPSLGIVVSKLNALKIANATGDVAQNINFAIKASVARDFLEANAVTYATAKSAKKMDTPDLADRMKAYTVEVQCDR